MNYFQVAGSALNCGNRVTTYTVCPSCSRELHPETELCPSCQTVIPHEEAPDASDAAPEAAVIEASPLEAKEESLKKSRKEKDAKSRIGVAKMIILITGIILLATNTLFMAFLFAAKSMTAELSAPRQQQQQRTPEYRGFGEQDYNNQENNSAQKRGRENPFKLPWNLRVIFKYLLLVIIVGLVQGIFFMFLYKYIDKKPFIAVLIAFIFEITYDILKIAVKFVQMFSSFTNQTSLGRVSKQAFVLVSSIQILQLAAVSLVFVYFLYKSLQSSIALRKMGGS